MKLSLFAFSLTTIFTFAVLTYGENASAIDSGQKDSISAQCSIDLESIPGFLLENDAGAKDELALKGQPHFEHALNSARQEAAAATDAKICNAVLNTYLRAYRSGHLWVEDFPKSTPQPDTGKKSAVTGQGAPSRAPSIEILSSKTLLLRAPSFDQKYRQPLIDLIAQQRKALESHPNWIIDVRFNGGGEDSTYQALLPWLIVNGYMEIGAEWFATPKNIEAMENFCAKYAPGNRECEGVMAEVIKRMRTVPSGSFVQQEDGPKANYQLIEKVEPRRPTRVAILINHDCASSCEQFLLAARQGFNVKLVGEHSFGALDYSNVSVHELPSAKRILAYAISRSDRLPDMPVDLTGILPDIYFPDPSEEAGKKKQIIAIQSWLEDGSLKLEGGKPYSSPH